MCTATSFRALDKAKYLYLMFDQRQQRAKSLIVHHADGTALSIKHLEPKIPSNDRTQLG